jgi:hypothetical protein
LTGKTTQCRQKKGKVSNVHFKLYRTWDESEALLLLNMTLQVTFAKDQNKTLSKARELKQYCDESANTVPTIALFMGPETSQDNITRLGLKYVSIDSIFQQFEKTEFYKDMLDKMIGIK